MILNKPYNSKNYAEMAIYANENGLKIVDQGTYLETQPQYTEEELIELEKERISNLEISQENFWNYLLPITKSDAIIEIERVQELNNKILNSMSNSNYKRFDLIVEILMGIYSLTDEELNDLFDS